MVENAVLNLVSKVSKAIEKSDFFSRDEEKSGFGEMGWWIFFVGVLVLMGFEWC